MTLDIYYSMYECFKLTSSPDEADMQDSVAISHVVRFWEELKRSGMFWVVFLFFGIFPSFYFLLDQSRGGPLYRPVAFVVAEAGRMAIK